jgi:L-aminopeptidase/D-esterase-like protein
MNKQTNKQTMREPKLTGEAQVEEGRAGAGAGAWTWPRTSHPGSIGLNSNQSNANISFRVLHVYLISHVTAIRV